MSIKDKTDNEIIGELMEMHQGAQLQLNGAQTAIDAARAAVSGSVPLTQELVRRLFEQRELNAPPEVIGPGVPGVPEPEPPSMDHNQIIEYVTNAVPTEEALLARMGELKRMPMFGEPGFAEDWTVRDGDVYRNTHWDGLREGQVSTNAFIRVPGGGGTPYGYIDSLKFEECLIENACRWGKRLHGVRRGLEIGWSLTRNIRKEHGDYVSLCGLGGADPSDGFAVYVHNTLYKNIASQAWQSVQRDQYWPGDALHETPKPEWDFTPGGSLIFRNVGVIDGAKEEGDRESFDFSFFRSRNRVYMNTILIDDRAQPVSRGFQMAQGYHGLNDPYGRSIENDDFVWRSGASKQQAASYERMSRVELINGVIDVPEGQGAQLTFTDCSDAISIRNVTSLRAKVRVVIDGVDAGTVDQWDGYR